MLFEDILKEVMKENKITTDLSHLSLDEKLSTYHSFTNEDGKTYSTRIYIERTR